MTRYILIGTAGHIDHGKTRLVQRLTGIDTDRLPEEKARGISIDLGFAHWQAGEFHFGIVDVPGHERFIKNMVAGASGVDMALLVVAADDSVMPQTREHLEIMQLLGLKTGVVAITKADLVDPELLELVEDDVRQLTEGTFLEGCPIVPVSSETGEGFERLKQVLLEVAGQVQAARPLELFRMPIDRSLSIPGHGTVVTGSVISGEVHPGDTLELLPSGQSVRVRSVQNYGTPTRDSGPGRRTAINLAGIHHDEIVRGMELATPGYLRPTHRLVVRLQTLASSPVPLKDRMELSLHLGTAEVLARLVLKCGSVAPGASGYAELRTRQPIVASHGQRFILRRPSPAVTVAGGQILDPCVPLRKRIRDLSDYAGGLDKPDETDRLAAFLAQKESAPDDPLEAAWRAGIRPSRYHSLIDNLVESGVLVAVGSPEKPLLIHKDRWDTVRRAVMRTIRAELARQQPRRSLPRTTILTASRPIAPVVVLEAALDDLLASGDLVSVGKNLGPADAQAHLTRNQAAILRTILEKTEAAGLTPPTTKELAAEFGRRPREIEALQNVAAEEGLLVRLAEGLYFTPQALEAARAECEQFLDQVRQATLSQLRERWGISRKFAVPLCEHFDSLGVTVRRGDLRMPGPHIHEPLVPR